MASKPRLEILYDGCTFHITWQCHNKDWLLKQNWAKKLYYDLLSKYKKKHNLEIHSYCFMSNHVHFTGSCVEAEKVSRFMQVVNSCFAKAVNKKMGTSGQVVQGNYKSPTIETEELLLYVMRYLDINPYKAGMVKHPKKNNWSSYKHYAYGSKDKLITQPIAYQELGTNKEERQKAYRDIIDEAIENKTALEKKNYSTTCFIGTAEWVKEKYDKLKKANRKQEKNITEVLLT